MSISADPTASATDANALLTPARPVRFAAMDFEAADCGRDNALIKPNK
jgi:hypothetical protein